MTKEITVSFGADPEFFVKERKTGTIIPACGLFGGNKGAPVILSNEGGYLEDGVTIEINVAPADNIGTVRTRILNLISMFEQRFPDHVLECAGAAEFDKRELRKHRTAMEIGCSADMCAWGFRRAPQIKDMGAMRFAGGHIHVGMDPWPEGLEKKFVIQWLDLFALIPSIREINVDRYRYYGRPGLYRETGYGVEWRSPDPSWVVGRSGIALRAESAIRALVKMLGMPSGAAKIATMWEGIMESERVQDFISTPDLKDPYSMPSRWRQDMPSYLSYFLKNAA